MVKQKQPGLYALRLRLTGGDITAAQLARIARVATTYGGGRAHLTTRQGVEIHNIPEGNVDAACAELADVGLLLGATGDRVRVVVACPGSSSCRYGAIDTKAIAAELDRRFFGTETPYKVKMNCTGCPNNCGKAWENDIGIMGSTLPEWHEEHCSDCRLCVEKCPTGAIRREQGRYVIDRGTCIACSVCTTLCPTGAWTARERGAQLLIGGTMGKKPRLATPLKTMIRDTDELVDLVQRCVRYYQANGRPKERFGHMIDRLGANIVKTDLLADI